MSDLMRKEIEEAIDAADEALYHLKAAKDYLNSAGNWGLFDIFGGDTIAGLVKHSKMGKAEREIQEAKFALQRFDKELRDVNGYSSIHIDDFLTIADFVFDGLIMDIWVQSKISDAKKQCDGAIAKVQSVRRELAAKL
ncbi:MAG: hypothetical protein K6F63_06630 [Lachnospiraceae bacterium]|nr:hypothetical protein [Lachnospiraceae bacterium]